MNKRKPVQVARLDRFIAQCMEPLPDAELSDPKYNKLVRKTREPAWQDATCGLHFFRYAYQAATWAKFVTNRTPDASETIRYLATDTVRTFFLDNLHKTQVQILRTPAPDYEALAVKRSIIRRSLASQRIGAEEVATLIAADEAFLAAHPFGHRRTGRRSKAEG